MYCDEDDIESVTTTLRSGMNWAVGSEVAQFETEIADYIGSKYCLTFNSGTSALHAALLAHGIGAGDEVIVPSFTFIATANAPLFVGARSVFADIEEKTLGLDPESVCEQITPRTRALIPVHYGGCPCMIRELRGIAEDHNLLLIEDAAEALGASVNKEKVGTFGDSAMLSFCQNKIITTGEGGALLTDDRDVYEKSKLIRSHGRLETVDYFSSCDNMDYITLGYNFRLSNIASALGRAQLRKVDTLIRMREKIAETYTSRIKANIPKISPLKTPDGYQNVFQLYSVRVQKRDELMQYLAEHGVMSKVYFTPVHMTTHYQKKLSNKALLPVTERIADEIISLPIYPGMPEDDIWRVVDVISKYYEGS